MRSTILLCGLLTLHVGLLQAQPDSVAMRYAATITQEDLRRHLEILASDAYEGRETGMEGQKMAAAYIEQQFKLFGVPPVPDALQRGMKNGYQQSFALELSRPGGLHVQAGEAPFGFLQDYLYFSERLQHDLSTNSIAVAAPAAMSRVPADAEVALVLEERKGAVVKGSIPGGSYFQRITELTVNAPEHVQVILYATDEASKMIAAYGHYIGSPRMQLADEPKKDKGGVQVIVITRSMADALLSQARTTWAKAVKRARKRPFVADVPVRFTYVPSTETLSSENVLAYIEGSTKKDEVVVVTAHYDHIGVADGEVYNGADDDGSGTVALLEMAQAFAQAKAEGHGPLRSVLFMPVSGEEKGLLGSEYYSEHPVFPLANMVADVNIDMIGRVDSTHADSKPYVYVIGSDRLSSELHAINERANATYTHLDLDYTFNAESDPNRFYYRSDHYNFAKHGVPSVFFFSGVHEDYHGPKDEVDRIRFDLLQQRTLLVFYTTWELANRPERIVVDRPLRKE